MFSDYDEIIIPEIVLNWQLWLAQTRGNMLAYHSLYDICVANEAATLTISTLLAFRGWCLIHY